MQQLRQLSATFMLAAALAMFPWPRLYQHVWWCPCTIWDNGAYVVAPRAYEQGLTSWAGLTRGLEGVQLRRTLHAEVMDMPVGNAT